MNIFERIKSSFILDLRSLAIFRVAIALCIISDLLSRFRYIEFFQTGEGFLPQRLDLGLQRFLPHNWDNTYSFQVVLFCLALIFAVMLLVGWRTKLATFLSWLMLISLHSRLEISTDGSDIFLRGLLLWSMFLPLGSHWSVDSKNVDQNKKFTECFSLGGTAIILFFIFYYFSAGLSKLNDDWLVNSALEIILRQELWLRSTGSILSEYPGFLKILSPTIVVFEIVAPFALLLPHRFFKLRLIAIGSFVVFQFGMGICLDLNMMPWIATAAILLFVPSAFWAKLSPQNSTLHSERNRLKNTILIPLMIVVFGGFFLQKAGGSQPASSVLYTAGLYTTWSFYDHPPQVDYDYRIVAELENGKTVKVLSSLNEQPNWKNSTMNNLWQNYRFKYYLETISYENTEEGHVFLKWIVKQWEAEHHGIEIESADFICSETDILKPHGAVSEYLISQY
ncbi:MAG: HTTM domain-containing protein [Crocinitomicaceae bacterium]|nr:HTTM domain-containing protein [Crocinitomicaceae bacterium]